MRFGLHQSWEAFSGTDLSATRINWVRFHYSDKPARDDLSGLDSLPAPHQSYVHVWLGEDAAYRDAIFDAVITHVRLPKGLKRPSRLAVMERARFIQPGPDGPYVEERERQLATVDVEGK